MQPKLVFFLGDGETFDSRPYVHLNECLFGLNNFSRDIEKRFLPNLFEQFLGHPDNSCVVDMLFLRMTVENASSEMLVKKLIDFAFENKAEVYNGVEKIRMDAPKLKSMEYTGRLTSFPGIKASQELEYVKFYLLPEMLDAGWFIWLRYILGSFGHSKHLGLICRNEQAIIFPDEPTEILLLTINDLKNLELQIDSSAATSQQILDGFTWILPVSTEGDVERLLVTEKNWYTSQN